MKEIEIKQELDENGKLIIRDAKIDFYLGEGPDGTHRYVLILPAGTAHQTGPYEMRRQR